MNYRTQALEPLRDFINFDDEGFAIYADFATIAALHVLEVKPATPCGPPVLVISGERGSGKTIAATALRNIIPYIYDADALSGNAVRITSQMLKIPPRAAIVSHQDFGPFARAMGEWPLKSHLENTGFSLLHTRPRDMWPLAGRPNPGSLEKVTHQARKSFWWHLHRELEALA